MTGLKKVLAHEDDRSSRAVYNKAEYAEQRRHMLQEWANMIDAGTEGGGYIPSLMLESMSVPTLKASVWAH